MILTVIFAASLFGRSISVAKCASGEDTYCMGCNGEKCLYCVNSYLGSDGNCVPVPKGTIEHCESYISETLCYYCQAGYSLEDDNMCHELPFGCAAGQNGFCSYCFNGYAINSNGNGCNSEMCRQKNCNWCGSEQTGCVWCRSGFLLEFSSLNCIQAPSHLSNCIRIGQDGNTCALCDEGHMIAANKTCIPSKDALIKNSEKMFRVLLILSLTVLMVLR